LRGCKNENQGKPLTWDISSCPYLKGKGYRDDPIFIEYFIVKIKNYAYLVPFTEDEEGRFLKTIGVDGVGPS
jgi:hypothetical protein